MFTFDVRTQIGLIRLLIPDKEGTEPLFQDEELSAFLILEGDERRAAALALETLASDQALTQKAIRLLDLNTDGAKVADSLLKRAARLREQAAAQDAENVSEADAGFDVAEYAFEPFGARERIWNARLRGG